MKTTYYQAVVAKARACKWSPKKFFEFIRKNKGKPYAIALKNLEKES